MQRRHVDANTIRRNVRDIAAARYYPRDRLIEASADEDNLRVEEFEGY